MELRYIKGSMLADDDKAKSGPEPRVGMLTDK